MDILIKADIFFFISSIAVVVLAILISILLFYLIEAGRSLRKLSKKLNSNYKDSEEFVIELKERLENNLIFRMFFPLSQKRRKNKKTTENEDQ